MALLDQLNTDMKVAMKAKDKFKLSVIRMLSSSSNAELTRKQCLKMKKLNLARELKVERSVIFRQADHVIKDNAVLKLRLLKNTCLHNYQKLN